MFSPAQRPWHSGSAFGPPRRLRRAERRTSNIRITQGNVFADSDAAGNGLAGTVVKKTGAGTATFEIPIDTNGTVSFRAQGGVSDFEVSQTLDALVIENGAVVTLSDLFTPPAPVEDGFAQAAEPLAGSPLQGVPRARHRRAPVCQRPRLPHAPSAPLS